MRRQEWRWFASLVAALAVYGLLHYAWYLLFSVYPSALSDNPDSLLSRQSLQRSLSWAMLGYAVAALLLGAYVISRLENQSRTRSITAVKLVTYSICLVILGLISAQLVAGLLPRLVLLG